jgi:precorrin-2 dehydrogenase/sirohydrochlorin ferrochelatase
MEAFPAFVPLKGRRVIIVGEGWMAEEKAALFVGSPAELVRLPEGPEALAPETYAGAALVFVASLDEALALRQAAAARAGGAMLINVVDRPPHCDFYTPAIVDRGAVVGAVGTTGQAPGLARKLKAALDASWPKGLAHLAAMIAALKAEARAALPDFDARKVFLESLLEGEAAEAALKGEMDAALKLARAKLPPLSFSGEAAGADPRT